MDCLLVVGCFEMQPCHASKSNLICSVSDLILTQTNLKNSRNARNTEKNWFTSGKCVEYFLQFQENGCMQ